jgi:sec-independent protein translocase protein TatC
MTDPDQNGGVERSRISDPRTMSFGEHLEELRRRLIWAIVLLAPIFGATLYWGNDLLEFILKPARRQLQSAGLPSMLQATGPLETLGAWLKVSGVITIVMGIPILIYQLWLFVKPGLYPHERRFAQFLVPLSVLLSLTGLAFLYYVMLPAMLHFLIVFGAGLGRPEVKTMERPAGVTFPVIPVLPTDPAETKPGEVWINRELEELRVDVTPAPEAGKTAPEREVLGTPMTKATGISQQYRVSEYIDLVFTMCLAFVAGFQTPVVVLLLGWVGIVDRKTLARSRKYAVFVAFLVAAILTPSPDPFNMTVLAVPLYILFELGLFLLRVFPPHRVARGVRARDLISSGTREGPDAGDE